MGSGIQQKHSSEISTILNNPKTGTFIHWKNKEHLLSLLKTLTLQAEKVHRLQPKGIPLNQGFLYLKGQYLYEGDIKDEVTMEGKGRISIIKPMIEYEGTFHSNSFEGEGVLLYRNKDTVIYGTWKEGVLVFINYRQYKNIFNIKIVERDSISQALKVQINYPDNSIYKGEVKYNKKSRMYEITGKGVHKRNDKVQLRGTFQNGVVNGLAQLYSQGNLRYRGEFKGGKFHGRGSYYYPDGSQLDIDWMENKPHGAGTFKTSLLETMPVSYHYGRKVSLLSSS